MDGQTEGSVTVLAASLCRVDGRRDDFDKRIGDRGCCTPSRPSSENR